MAKYLGRAQGNQKGPASGQRADLEAIGQAHISAVAGACLSIGIKFAGSANAAAEKVLRHYVLYFLKAKQQAPDSSAGEHLAAADATSLVRCCSLDLAEFIHSACRFVFGLYYQATHSMPCSPQCVHSQPVMHKQGDARQHVRTAGAWRGLDRQALEGCLGVVALALGVVMAGTGHLPTLKLLRGGSAFLDTSSLSLLGPIIPSPPPPPPSSPYL